MFQLFVVLLQKLGKHQEKQSEQSSLIVIYCMFLAFCMTLTLVFLITFFHGKRIYSLNHDSTVFPLANVDPRRIEDHK
jgi:hypothetical protein